MSGTHRAPLHHSPSLQSQAVVQTKGPPPSKRSVGRTVHRPTRHILSGAQSRSVVQELLGTHWPPAQVRCWAWQGWVIEHSGTQLLSVLQTNPASQANEPSHADLQMLATQAWPSAHPAAQGTTQVFVALSHVRPLLHGFDGEH